jgi:hypothetical protein
MFLVVDDARVRQRVWLHQGDEQACCLCRSHRNLLERQLTDAWKQSGGARPGLSQKGGLLFRLLAARLPLPQCATVKMKVELRSHFEHRNM